MNGKAEVDAAIADLAFARNTHLQWAEHLEAHVDSGEPCPQCAERPYKLDAAHEREWVAKYDRIIALVQRKEDGEMARFGHHPDPAIDAEVELDRLNGLLAEAHSGLLRALDYRAATPEGLAIKHDVRDALRRTGYVGNMGERAKV